MQVNETQLNEILRHNNWSRDELFQLVQQGILTGQIVVPTNTAATPVYAGGTNFCPNSDFSWSERAATSSGVTPAAAFDDNYECYRVFRQPVGGNISSTRVRAPGHSLYAANEGVSTYLPSWDRGNGRIDLGWDGNTATDQPGVVQTWYEGYRAWTTPFASNVRTTAIDMGPTSAEPYPGIGSAWSVSITGKIKFKYAEATTFKFTRLDDYVRLVVNGTTLIDYEGLTVPQSSSTFTPADTNTWYDFELRLANHSGPYNFDFRWLSGSLAEEPVPIDDTTNNIKHTSTAGSNYDIAFHMVQTWPSNARRRYIRVAVATNDATPIPDGLKLYAGLWVVRSGGGGQGWADGSGFTLSSRLNAVPGARQLQYKVIAKTDSGSALESAVLNVNDAPATLNDENYIELSYSGASAGGFIEFLVYRREVSTGRVDLIAHDRNSSQLWAYDFGQSIRVEPSGFPNGDYSAFRAYAEVPLDVFPVTQQLTFHSMTLIVPTNLNTDNIENCYLRIGLTGNTAHNRQITLDTVWDGESYNTWSQSPFDNYPSPRSTTYATAPVLGGMNPNGAPPGGGGGITNCLDVTHEVETDMGVVPIGRLTREFLVVNGLGMSVIESFVDAEVSQYAELEFENGMVVRCTPSHKWARSLTDSSGVLTSALRVGDTVYGYDGEKEGPIKLVSRRFHTSVTPLPVRALKVVDGSPNKLYRVRDGKMWLYSHNTKPDGGVLVS